MKFNSLFINFLCLSLVVACNTGPYLKTNAVDAFDLPLDASLNIDVDRDIPAKVICECLGARGMYSMYSKLPKDNSSISSKQ